MFVTFEGPEGAGKSTVLAIVSEHLRAEGVEVLTTREPGAGEVGRAIRKILLHGEELHPRAELFLFLADRSQHIERIVRPFLAESERRVVLCDRHADSTVVYQGYARGLDVEELRALNLNATGGMVPTRTYLLDLPVEVGLARLKNPDRLDREPIEFHQRVRQGFLAEAAREPDRWVVLDATRPPEATAADVLTDLLAHLGA